MDKNLIGLVQEQIALAERKFPYASATFFDNRGIEIRVDRKDEKISAKPSQLGFVFSLFNGEYFHEFATDHLDRESVASLCRNSIDDTELKKIRYNIIASESCKKVFKTQEKESLDRLDLKDKVNICRIHRDQIMKADQIINAAAGYFEVLNNKVFINRSRMVREEIRRMFYMLVAYASDGSQKKSNYLTVGGTGGLEKVRITEESIDELVTVVQQLLSAEKVEPNYYDVAVTPEIAGLIAHEAFGHGVETDMYLKDRSRSQEFLGKIVASPIVNIIDDPTLPGAYGSYFIDDEGEIAQATHIVKDGKFVQGLTDIYSRSVLRLPKSANGRRESFQRKVYTRMSNTFFQSGKDNKEDILESIDKGIYLIKGISGMEDPKGWGLQIVALYGREIKNGKLTGRIFSPIGITGYVPDLLQSISMVGADFALDPGSCGKGHKEYVPVSSGGPHLRAKMRLG